MRCITRIVILFSHEAAFSESNQGSLYWRPAVNLWLSVETYRAIPLQKSSRALNTWYLPSSVFVISHDHYPHLLSPLPLLKNSSQLLIFQPATHYTVHTTITYPMSNSFTTHLHSCFARKGDCNIFWGAGFHKGVPVSTVRHGPPSKSYIIHVC